MDNKGEMSRIPSFWKRKKRSTSLSHFNNSISFCYVNTLRKIFLYGKILNKNNYHQRNFFFLFWMVTPKLHNKKPLSSKPQLPYRVCLKYCLCLHIIWNVQNINLLFLQNMNLIFDYQNRFRTSRMEYFKFIAPVNPSKKFKKNTDVINFLLVDFFF